MSVFDRQDHYIAKALIERMHLPGYSHASFVWEGNIRRTADAALKALYTQLPPDRWPRRIRENYARILADRGSEAQWAAPPEKIPAAAAAAGVRWIAAQDTEDRAEQHDAELAIREALKAAGQHDRSELVGGWVDTWKALGAPASVGVWPAEGYEVNHTWIKAYEVTIFQEWMRRLEARATAPTFVAFMQERLNELKRSWRAKLAAAVRAIEDYEAEHKAKPPPMGISVVHAFMARNHRKREEKALVRDWEYAKKGLDNVESGDWLKRELSMFHVHGGNAGPQVVYQKLYGKYVTPKDESDARKLR